MFYRENRQLKNNYRVRANSNRGLVCGKQLNDGLVTSKCRSFPDEFQNNAFSLQALRALAKTPSSTTLQPSAQHELSSTTTSSGRPPSSSRNTVFSLSCSEAVKNSANLVDLQGIIQSVQIKLCNIPIVQSHLQTAGFILLHQLSFLFEST